MSFGVGHPGSFPAPRPPTHREAAGDAQAHQSDHVVHSGRWLGIWVQASFPDQNPHSEQVFGLLQRAEDPCQCLGSKRWSLHGGLQNATALELLASEGPIVGCQALAMLLEYLPCTGHFAHLRQHILSLSPQSWSSPQLSSIIFKACFGMRNWRSPGLGSGSDSW